MGYFVKINSKITKKYEEVGSDSFKNILGFLSVLKLQKTTHVGTDTMKETFYDTQDHLLSRSGIVLSRFEEGSNIFFKVENTAFLSKVLNKLEKEVFIHKIGYNDSLEDHAFYIKDGITGLFSTAFSIDLENVINNSKPIISVRTDAKIYNISSVNGMRINLALEKVRIKNLETKQSHTMRGMTIRLVSENVALFIDEFNKFNALILKNCKEFIETNENMFDYSTKWTKKIEANKKDKKNNDKKNKKK